MDNHSDGVKEIWSQGDYRSRGQFCPPVSAHLTKLVELQVDHSVLDIACGYGNTAITVRMKDANVTGIDITPKLSVYWQKKKKK